jgi:WD40 repeat protein
LRLAYSPDGRHLAVVYGIHGATATIWDTTTAKQTCSFQGQTGPDLCVAFSPDGRHVASAGMDFTVRIWDPTTGKEVQALKVHEWPIHGLVFSPDGRRLASCSADATVRVWDWTTSPEFRVLEPRHAARIYGVALSRDGELLASAGWDRTIKVWDARTGNFVHELPDASGAVQCVAFGQGRRLAWGSTDGTVKISDGPGTQTHVLRGHTSWVQGVAFSPDSPNSQWIASASLDGTVKIWKAPPELKSEPAEARDQGNKVSAPPEED